MIITRTPFRLSFAGGGTDFYEYYKRNPGFVISSAINKYMYVSINERFDGKINLRYSETEEVSNIDDIKHTLIRESLKMVNINKGIEIVTTSDIPSKGSGLGSSSALSIGLLKALYAYKGYSINDPKILAEKACNLEIDILKSPIGKQDQFACSYGGIKQYKFCSTGVVLVEDLRQTCNLERLKQLQEESMLFYLGISRSSNDILKEHEKNIEERFHYLDKMVELEEMFHKWLLGENTELKHYQIINESWELKKSMTEKCTTDVVDTIVEKVKNLNGDIGVKICGAGAGGFMLVLCPSYCQNKVRMELSGLHELKFDFVNSGSEVIYDG